MKIFKLILKIILLGGLTFFLFWAVFDQLAHPEDYYTEEYKFCKSEEISLKTVGELPVKCLWYYQ